MPERRDFAKPLNLSGKIVQIPLKALKPPLSWSGFEKRAASIGALKKHIIPGVSEALRLL